MIRVNLLKAKSSSAGRLESLATPRDGTFIARREIAVSGLFLLAGALILFFQLRDPQPSEPVLAGAEQASEKEYIDAIMDEEVADSPAVTNATPEKPGQSGQEKATETSGGEIPGRPQLVAASPNPAEPMLPRRTPSTEAADKPLPATITPPTGTPAAGQSGKLTQLVVSLGDESLRIFALTGKQPEYSSFRLDHPKRVAVDLPGVQLSLPRGQLQQTVADSLVTKVRAGQFRAQPPTARLVLEVESYPEIEFLPQFNGLYLVVSGKAQ